MKQSVATRTDDVPYNNPCAQCGKPIGTALWSEASERCIAYVWRCESCDYEFTAYAMFARPEIEHRIAA